MNDPFSLLKSTIAGAYRIERLAHVSPTGVVYRGIELGSRFQLFSSRAR